MNMKKFRLPRKVKKTLNKKTFCYPISSVFDEYIIINPTESQVAYNKFKSGIVKNIINFK